ncbi:uncharacterized protein LOC143286573 [Babylonia areolata]|uniref:uncharacterized protein LOC143286573 n=1 Tax=Babylonia areolata TaxID=304850 RepID=UPI003FD41B72
MSKNDNININDHSDKKMSAAKKIYNVNPTVSETETSPAESETASNSTAASSVNNLNKKSDNDDSQDDDKLSKECDNERETEGMDEKVSEERAACGCSASSSPTLANNSAKASDKIRDENEEERGKEGNESPPQASASAAEEPVDTESKESEVRTETTVESPDRLKMNIAMGETPKPQSVTEDSESPMNIAMGETPKPHSVSENSESPMNIAMGETPKPQSVTENSESPMNIAMGETPKPQSATENPESPLSTDNCPNVQADEEKTEDKKEACVSGEKDASKETNKQNTECVDEPAEVDKHTDKAIHDVCPDEKGKSDSENEEINVDQLDVTMESTPENSPSRDGDKESKLSNVDNQKSQSKVNDSDTDAEKKEEKNEDRSELATGSRAEGTRRKEEKSKGVKKEEHKNLKPSSFLSSRTVHSRRHWSEDDTQTYRDGYPGKIDFPELTRNLDFYQGKIRCEPHGDYIDNIHDLWWDDYDLLETHHGYIQWLFPIRESGMNWQAQELQLHEAEVIRADEAAMKRFKKSYEMMLNFYGIHLIDSETGEVERARNYKKRFEHLNFSMHNNLRITRILKCLGELGLERFKAPFLRLVLYEAIMTRLLDRTLRSCCDYWIGTVKDDVERQSIHDFAEQLQLQDEQVSAKRDCFAL